mgnify:CR=1 FL=1
MAALENDSRLITNRWLLALAAAGGLALLLYLLEPILLPFVAGGLIAYLGDPLVDALERRRLNRTVAVALVFAAWAILVLVVLALLAPLLIHQLDVLVHKVPAIYAWLTQTVLPWISAKLDLPQGQVPQLDWTGQLADNWQSLGRVTAQVMKKITGSGATALLWMANVVLIPVVAFYLMRDWDRLMDKALAVMPLAWQEKVSSMVTESHEVVGAFLRGQFLVMCSLGMIYSFGLWLVGVLDCPDWRCGGRAPFQIPKGQQGAQKAEVVILGPLDFVCQCFLAFHHRGIGFCPQFTHHCCCNCRHTFLLDS